MGSENAGLRECPFCKEEIKAAAVRCKHCHSRIQPDQPGHGGICPYCKEAIKPEAIKCKHCGSNVGPGPSGCRGCGKDTVRLAFMGSGLSGMSPLSTGAQTMPLPGVAAAPNCTDCHRVGGPLGSLIRGVRICCRLVWIPFLGVQNVCYLVPCEPPASDVVIA